MGIAVDDPDGRLDCGVGWRHDGILKRGQFSPSRAFVCLLLLSHTDRASGDGPHGMRAWSASAGAALRCGRVLNRRGAGERKRIAGLLMESSCLRVVGD